MCRSKPQVAQNRGHFQHFLDPFGETERGETGKAIQAKQCDPLNVEYTGQGIVEQCQRRSKISPPGRSKTSPLNVMRYAVLGGCPGSP